MRCSVCDTEFNCDSGPDSKGCWCSSYPTIMPLDSSQSCRCPSCLQKAIHERIAEALANKPIADVVEMAKPLASSELVEGIDYTIESGNYVFTSWFHLKRGNCCGNGCRHCPYPKN
ncbi:DUF5522 domain-containing protein [Neptuniibacter sp.]|uniref:DUF5522 domain-containing protein n=1 Tax=Neptuniibacter sp. TaxID=1962643 RepID=UPI0026184287|nr:DUF5522 domain-containing protein [Neptuniibacter sp.]MCP4595558.1 hypothetical protein [Neptuniibacter sp.]